MSGTSYPVWIYSAYLQMADRLNVLLLLEKLCQHNRTLRTGHVCFIPEFSYDVTPKQSSSKLISFDKSTQADIFSLFREKGL